MADIPKNLRRVDSFNLRDIPTDVKAQFKAYCARRGASMRSMLILLMQEAYTRDRPLHPKQKRHRVYGKVRY